MVKIKKIILIAILLIISLTLFAIPSPEKAVIKTSQGDIVIKLYSKQSPITVENFKQYIKAGFYENTVFHRVIDEFMIQGGGFTTEGEQKETNPPIILESNNGLSNEKGTLAMARTLQPNSATSQFFINTKDNEFLDYGARDQGYAVFAKVIRGMNVVEKIESSQTTQKNGMTDWPIEEIIIYNIELI